MERASVLVVEMLVALVFAEMFVKGVSGGDVEAEVDIEFEVPVA
jgi:hypothetical protein